MRSSRRIPDTVLSLLVNLHMRSRLHAASALLLVSVSACAGEPSDTNGAGSSDRDVVSASADEASGSASADVDREPTVHTLANLGDSISEGYDADDAEPIEIRKLIADRASVFREQRELSWVQGTDPRVASIARHYRALDPGLLIAPFSRAGSEIVGDDSALPNFEEQARQITAANVKPDMVYVLLGGNDVCNRPRSLSADATATMYSVARLREYAVRGLSALVEALPAGATVRVVSMPRVDRLYATIAMQQIAVRYTTASGPITSALTCKAFWTAVAAADEDGVCKIVTTEPLPEKRAQIGARIDAYNDALAEEVRRFATDPALNPKGIVFRSDWQGRIDKGGVKDASGGTFVYEAIHISKRDCFHPSIEGQNALAKMVLERASFR